ncbi:MAG: hypothetical protein K8U57_15830 [Planctomycetes bacterium]|nr:hypothetical protein [Planctomycetota bacterium]
MMRYFAVVVAIVGFSLLVGCADEREAEVSGNVNIDGKPLQEGEIIFEAPDGSKTPGTGPIKQGHYTAKVLPGMKSVKILASRQPKTPDPMLGAAAREPMIAPEFNLKTKLTVDLKPGKNDGVDFEVKALPR